MAPKSLLSTFISLLLALTPCIPAAAAEHHGLVKFGGLPVPGATVTATKGDQKMVAVTDSSGVYSFPDLADGVWNLQVEMLTFAPAKMEVAVAANAPSPEWELKLLSFDEIKASAPPPATIPTTPPPADRLRRTPPLAPLPPPRRLRPPRQPPPRPSLPPTARSRLRKAPKRNSRPPPPPATTVPDSSAPT